MPKHTFHAYGSEAIENGHVNVLDHDDLVDFINETRAEWRREQRLCEDDSNPAKADPLGAMHYESMAKAYTILLDRMTAHKFGIRHILDD